MYVLINCEIIYKQQQELAPNLPTPQPQLSQHPNPSPNPFSQMRTNEQAKHSQGSPTCGSITHSLSHLSHRRDLVMHMGFLITTNWTQLQPYQWGLGCP